MKANEFVKRFGWELAQRDVCAFSGGFIKREDFVEHYGFDILDDLKRLVESWELVEYFGGLEEASKVICNVYCGSNHSIPDGHEELSIAITDVESCQ